MKEEPAAFLMSFESGIIDLTRDLRRATIQRHLGVLSGRVGRPLDALLTCFVVGAPRTRAAAFAWANQGDRVRVARPEFDPDDRKPGAARYWTDHGRDAVLTAVLSVGPPLHDVVAGIVAASDRIFALWVIECDAAWRDPTLLPALFDLVASAYATGVAVARALDGSGRTELLTPIVRAFCRIDDEDRGLLTLRYGANYSLQWLASIACVDQDTISALLTEALDEILCLSESGRTTAPPH